MKISNDAQAVIVKIENNGEPIFLIIKRFDKEKNDIHFRLVKGGVKKGESSEQAAIRETKEEVGIDSYKNISFLCHYDYIGGDIKHEVDVYVIQADFNVQILIDSAEEGGNIIYDGIWMDIEEAEEKLTFAEEKKIIKEAFNKIKSYF